MQLFLLPLPDLAPFNFHLLAPWRIHSKDDELKKSVREEFRPFSQDLYAERLMQSGKSLSIMNESLWKNKLNVVIDVPMTYIYFLILIIFSEKKNR
jgi:hypothetical protein